MVFAIISARRENSRADVALSVTSLIAYSFPVFWTGIILILLFASHLKLLPTVGMFSPASPGTGLGYVADVARHLVLPVASLSLAQLAIYQRITRSSIIEHSKEEYVTLLKATGLRTRSIFNRYILRNALLPTVTIVGIQLGYLVAGAVLVEVIFGWPGVGQLLIQAISMRDYPLVMGIYSIIAISVGVAIFLTDLSYAILDPRIRYS